MIITKPLNVGVKNCQAREYEARAVSVERAATTAYPDGYLITTTVKRKDPVGEYYCFERMYISPIGIKLLHDAITDLVRTPEFNNELDLQVELELPTLSKPEVKDESVD